jgi:putative flippase GtrA
MKIVKFFGTSIIATALDFTLYAVLIRLLSPTVANLISASVGLLTNFCLQRSFVFNPSNRWYTSLVLSILFSVVGLGIGTGLIYIMTNFTILSRQPLLAKVISTAVIFFYNYFTKKVAFGHKDRGRPSSC